MAYMNVPVYAHTCMPTASPVFLLSLRFQVWALLFPKYNQTLYLMTLDSALCSSSRDYLAECQWWLWTAFDGMEKHCQQIMLLSFSVSSFIFSGRKLYPLSFQSYKIVILCLRFLKLGEDANGSRGKVVWKKFRRLAINQSIVKM